MIYATIIFQLMFFTDSNYTVVNKEFESITECMAQGAKSVEGSGFAFECRMVEKTIYPGDK